MAEIWKSGCAMEIRDVSLRDGLQMLQGVVPTADKMAMLDALYAAGLRHIEVTSMVPKDRFPQFADGEQVINHARSLPDLKVAVLVPNLRGAQLAIAAGAHRVNVVVSASEAHNQANVGRSTADSVDGFRKIVEFAGGAGRAIEIGAAIATAFGCTLQGTVPVARVVHVATELAAAGADEIGLADTVGYADPRSIGAVCARVAVALPSLPVMLHLHDTRGLAAANVVAGIAAGVHRYDAALAGLGGCPFSPGASGNVALEDINHMLQMMGYETGIDPLALGKVRQTVQNAAPGEVLRGHVLTASPVHADFKPSWRHAS